MAERALSTLGLFIPRLDRIYKAAPRGYNRLANHGWIRIWPEDRVGSRPSHNISRGITMNEWSTKVPRHLWIVGALTSLWNAVGAFDYAATQFRVESYMSQFTPEQLAYFYGFPAWADAAWAIAVWCALLGSLCLLLRKAWAVWLFGASIVGMVLTGLYSYVLTDGMALMGTGGAVFTAVIWLIAFSLFFYARTMARRGVLR